MSVTMTRSVWMKMSRKGGLSLWHSNRDCSCRLRIHRRRRQGQSCQVRRIRRSHSWGIIDRNIRVYGVVEQDQTLIASRRRRHNSVWPLIQATLVKDGLVVNEVEAARVIPYERSRICSVDGEVQRGEDVGLYDVEYPDLCACEPECKRMMMFINQSNKR